MDDTDFIWRFTPSRTDPLVLEEIFVQRQELLTDIVERVRESVETGNKHQSLLIGPRGVGKTHLITLLHHRIMQDAALSGEVRIAWLLEDETITSFVQLLKRIYELLAEEYPDEFPHDWLEEQLDRSPAKILKALEAILVEKFRDKTLLLLVENLDLVFEGLGDAGQKQWRAYLQTHPFTAVVATSQRLFKSVQNREQPFFGFFKPDHLKPLPPLDAVALLGRIAHHRGQSDLVTFLATPEGRSRVRALHHLAGGNHRIYIVLSGFITRESLDELAGPFEKMADELTPYYQERMRWLTPQQRQIVEYLCSRDETCTPKDIARQLLTTENTVSSQLKKLLELGYVVKSPRGRQSLYELAEPLMRLASEVKDKRQKPLRLLIGFLRVWYRPEVLPQLLERAGTSSLRVYLEAAISQSRSTPDPRLEILEAEIERAKQDDRLEDLLDVYEERAHARGVKEDWIELGHHHYTLKDFKMAIECFDKALEVGSRYALAQTMKGEALSRVGCDENAVANFDKPLEADPRDSFAWTMKGRAMSKLGRNVEAVECFSRAIEADPRDAFAWTIMGQAMSKVGRYEEAIDCFNRALEADSRYAFAWRAKGSVMSRIGRDGEAVEFFDKALEANPRDTYAWTRKGLAIFGLGHDEEAVDCFDKALEVDPRYALAWAMKGEVLSWLGLAEEAVMCFSKALETNPKDINVAVEIGRAFSHLGRYDAAQKCYEQCLRYSVVGGENSFLRCEARFALRQWDAGFKELQEAFVRSSRSTDYDVKNLVGLILMRSEGNEDLRLNLVSLITAYREAGILIHLGDGLIRSLRRIDHGRLSDEMLRFWRDSWMEFGSAHTELVVPLRIFCVGIEYLIRVDEKILLDLVTAERVILQQALGLDSKPRWGKTGSGAA